VPGRTPREREELARQNAAIMAVFERAGFDHIAPDIIQPADIFLERSGEDIRARTFVFADPAGNELCLRPDLTVPACRYHLSHAGDPAAEARYCYLGPAFRFPDEKSSPQEFQQAGLEWFASPDAVAAEARILKLTLGALEAAGLSKYRVTLGDLGLFTALLEDTPMPPRWRERLQHHFWRPQAFRETLERFAAEGARKRSSISPLVDAVASAGALAVVQRELSSRKLQLVGGREMEDIAERLAGKFSDRSEPPLPRDSVDRILTYLDCAGTADQLPQHLARLGGGPRFAGATSYFARRLEAMEEQGLNPRRFAFAATFGRDLEYYTGFVFQVEADAAEGPLVVAGGGRYDNLLSDMGAASHIPAVGCAIHAERLKAVLS
jgi:ATP phosphoribosyltransferase regulatory subunit